MKPSKRRGTEDVKTSFEALYDRVAERLLIYLARRVRDPDAAAELWAGRVRELAALPGFRAG